MELEEHHMWNDQTWLVGSSLALPSNFRMSEGCLVCIEGQPASWCMGSFINCLKSGRLNPAIKGGMGTDEIVQETFLLDVTNGIDSKPTPGWVPALVMGLDLLMICS